MAVERVVLLLALASLLAVHAADVKPAGSFVDWLAKQSSTKAQTASSYYEEVESETVCLQAARIQSCSTLHEKNGLALRQYSEIKLSCCASAGEEKYHTAYEELLAQKHTVGTCHFTEDIFEKPITYEGSPNTEKIGIFEATCELKGEASKCGSPLCDGMTLIVTGDILGYKSVAFMGSLADILAEPRCASNQGLSLIHKRAMPVRGAGASVAQADEPAEATTFKVGSGNIYVGTFWVTSRHHKTSYKTGELQFVVATGDAGSYRTEAAPPSKSYVAKDLATALTFFKHEEASSY